MSLEKENNIKETKVKSIGSYTVYEFGVEIKNYGIIVFLANIKNENNKDLLEISLKTSVNSGTTHFVVGFYINDISELGIAKEIERLFEANYFDAELLLALKSEELLEHSISGLVTVETLQEYIQSRDFDRCRFEFSMDAYSKDVDNEES